MGFLELFGTASIPVLNVLLVTGVGSFIATNYIGILHEEARKNLNNLGAVFLWSYVYNIVRVTSNTVEDKANVRIHSPTIDFQEESVNLIHESCKSNTSVSSTDESELPVSISEECSANRKVSVCKVRQIFSSVLSGINFKRLFAPSTIGVIVGFIVGLIPLIRKALIGEGAPLRVIQDSASLLGDGAIPTVTLIMGGNLLKGLRGSGIRASLVIGVIVVRFLLLPLIGIVIVKGAVRLGLVHADPLYQFVLLLQYTVPPAMNIGTITQLFGAGESECSVIFLWAYGLASISLTIWCTFFMWLVS